MYIQGVVKFIIQLHSGEDLTRSDKRICLHVSKRKSVCLEDESIQVEEPEWSLGIYL